MLLTLNLTSEIEQYLSQKATEKGLSLEAYLLKFSNSHFEINRALTPILAGKI
ncbi:hypothetical protein PN502_20270 [Microcystis aeruginosa CS-338/01]|uniref:hypothetical protein n=1 Tax=Microcystis aeruginosa TaxID=1126 RepID=UPI00232D652E|nr:hypothetical protein [Microcystis aeruginosa]MDB9509341.1 hypothetical protein [Microcystis aeruginosa CS-338/01]